LFNEASWKNKCIRPLILLFYSNYQGLKL